MVNAAGQVAFPVFGTDYGIGPRPSKELLTSLILKAPPCPMWFGVTSSRPAPDESADEQTRMQWHAELAAERELAWPGWWAEQMIKRYRL